MKDKSVGAARMLLLALGLAGCLDSGNQDSEHGPALKLLYIKETNQRDHADFCQSAMSSQELGYRDGDTLRLLFGKNFSECGRPVLSHSMVIGGTTTGDSVLISAQSQSGCLDTLLPGYIEAAYKLLREDTVRFVYRWGVSLVSDTSIVLPQILEPFPCGD